MTTSRPPQLVNGILTSWIPLTTTGPSFSQACSSAIYMPPGQQILAAFDPWYGEHVNTQQQCLAQEMTTWWDQTKAPSTTYLLGPFACPTQYFQVASRSIDATSTLIACCPSGYKYLGSIYSAPTPSQCISIATSGQVITYIGRSSGTWTPNSTTFGPSGGTILGAQLNGYVFADAVTTSTVSSSASATTTSTSNTVAQQTSSSSSSSASNTGTGNSSPSGLSSGAKIGLGVGISLGILGFAALLAAYLLYRQTKARKDSPAELHESNSFIDTLHPNGHNSEPGTPSAASSNMRKQPPMNEMHAPPYTSEVHGDARRVEMAA